MIDCIAMGPYNAMNLLLANLEWARMTLESHQFPQFHHTMA
jgi:hypothetical protein